MSTPILTNSQSPSSMTELRKYTETFAMGELTETGFEQTTYTDTMEEKYCVAGGFKFFF
jgi:hypothetical protein